MPDRPVTVLLIHRNQPRHCLATERAFLAQTVPVRIVVVDNGSTAEALAELRAGLRAAQIWELGDNLGFGPGANVGLRRWLAEGPAAGEWVALAPHDALPEPGCLATMLTAVAAESKAGLASAEYGTDEIPIVDPYFGGITVPARRGDGWQPAGFVHGTLLLARRACLQQIGLFDERYFAYCEEADLSVRAAAAGWEVGIVWGAVVRNPEWSAAPVADYLMLRNSLLLVRTHFGRYKVTIRWILATMQLLRALLSPAARPVQFNARGRVLALADFVRGRFGPPPASIGRAGR